MTVFEKCRNFCSYTFFVNIYVIINYIYVVICTCFCGFITKKNPIVMSVPPPTFALHIS